METIRIYEADCDCSADYEATSLAAVKYYPCPEHPQYGKAERRDFRANPCDTYSD